MSKKGRKALASATLMSLVLTTVQVNAAPGQVTRIGAADRYATAAQVATQNWTSGAKDVVLVSGEGYADAVSASALAKQLNAPILLTTAGSLNTDAKAALETLKPTNVYVVGGNASVSASVRSDLKAANYNLVELQGVNRYETNVAVAKKLVELGVKADNVLLVGGEGFSDALSVAPVAAGKGQILLLGNNNEDSMKSVIDFVKANSSKVTVVGTTNVISDAIYNAVGAVERVNGGASRFETNLNVLNKFAADLKADKLYVANASGNGYADALVASALAGKAAAPLVLVDTEGTSATTAALDYIKGKATKTTDLNVVGGTGVVSDATVKAINEAVNPTTPVTNGDNTVSEINQINLNSFDVVFNTNVDEDTAELEQNYKVGSTELSSTNAHAELISDNTVRITLLPSATGLDISQGEEKTVYVQKGILTEDKTETIEKYSEKVEFKDVTAPTLKSVSVRGNNKLVIEFSEPVNMGNTNFSNIKSLIQVNGKTLSNIDTTGTYSKFKNAISSSDSTETWSDKVEFYLNTALKSGENTIKVKDASGDILEDAAGFGFKEAEETVTVDEVSTTPEVKDITCTDDGEIRITFDRAMDAKTAVNNTNYTINDKPISNAKIELKENDTVVKITDVGTDSNGDDILRDTMNVLEMSDGIKDAYGNKVEDETRVSFEKEKDETKPTVLSATVIDDETLRVQFSEDVKYTYATNIDNYELKDAYDVDLMDKDGVYIVASDASTPDPKDDKDNTDTYDIKFDESSYKLDSSKYTLTVSDIVDLATDPNKMDDQTLTIDGNDDTAPSIDDIVVFRKSADEVSIYFGKEMDSSTLTDRANYYFIDGDGDSEELPDDVDITVSDDNKGVVLDFEDADKEVYVTSLAPTGDDSVKRIGIKTVKDASGNELYAGALDILAADNAKVTASAPKIESKSFKLYKDGDDVKAEFKLDTALDTAYENDFAITSTEDSNVSITPNNAETSGRTVTLTFNEGDNADAVMALGTTAKLTVVGTESQDIAGRSIQAGTPQVVYYNNIAPETDRDKYSATVTYNGTPEVVGATVYITMKTPVDTGLVGSYKDDFIITDVNTGKNLDVEKVEQKFVKGTVYSNTFTEGSQPVLVFTIQNAKGTIAFGDEINVTAATDEDDLDIRTAADVNGKHVDFIPSDDDNKVKKFNATKVSADDITKPVITVNSGTDTITVGDEFVDAGATAEDEVDGVLDVITTGNVDTAKAGTYTITYTATDKTGNTATETREVIVEEAV